MSVMPIFLPVEGQALNVEYAGGMRKSLHLRGNQLVDEHGVVLAELVEDGDHPGRFLWQVFAVDAQQRMRLGGERHGLSLQEKGLYQEVAIVGQGRLLL